MRKSLAFLLVFLLVLTLGAHNEIVYAIDDLLD